MKINSIIYGKKVEATLWGKCNKERQVTITDTVGADLKSYMKELHPNADKYDNDYFFM